MALGGVAGAVAAGVKAGLREARDIGALSPDVISRAFSPVMTRFADGLQQTADRLARFSPDITGARAQATVAQIIGDMRRAERIGPELGEFIQARSEFQQAAQDTLTEIIKPLIPLATAFFEAVTPIIKWVGDTAVPALLEGVNAMIGLLNDIIGEINAILNFFGSKFEVEDIKKIEYNTRKQPAEYKDAIQDFLKIKPLRASLLRERRRLKALRRALGRGPQVGLFPLE
jgi:hypothetical protein